MTRGYLTYRIVGLFAYWTRQSQIKLLREALQELIEIEELREKYRDDRVVSTFLPSPADVEDGFSRGQDALNSLRFEGGSPIIFHGNLLKFRWGVHHHWAQAKGAAAGSEPFRQRFGK